MARLLSVKEVAVRLGVRPSTVRAGVKRGLIPAVILWKGRRRSLIRFRAEDVERIIEERATDSEPPSVG